MIGISGIDTEGTLLDFDFQEVAVSQEIIAGARQVFWLRMIVSLVVMR